MTSLVMSLRQVLVEYIEQFPPLLANPGMASRLITYFRKPNEDDDVDDEYEIPKPSVGPISRLSHGGE